MPTISARIATEVFKAWDRYPTRIKYFGWLWLTDLSPQQTDDLSFTIKDFSARAGGRSPSGIAMQPRSSSGSTARTVHYFKKVSGKEFWHAGIAYAGDLSMYPGKSNENRA